jgi:pyruvate formate lyase activating enzyme
MKDRASSGSVTMPEQVVEEALAHECCSISYTYTEPTIYFEYAYDISRLAAKAGLYNVFVTNGYMTRECIETAHLYLHAANIDLKSFRNDFYTKTCKGSLQPVLDSIRLMRKFDIWVEVTTLLIPDQNDSDEELNDIAAFLAETGKEIPWHISAFHPDYRYDTSAPTPIGTLRRAQDIGLRHGLRYVYMGNVPEGSDTYCYNCRKLLIQRKYFTVEKIHMNNGKCASCSAPIDGVWK